MPRPPKRQRQPDAREMQRDAAAAILDALAYDYVNARATKVEACARSVRQVLLDAYARPAGKPATLPLCAPKGPKESHASCEFKAPSKVAVVGSWLLRTGLKREADLDLAVELPSTLVSVKDLANGRFFAKRAAYLVQCGHVLAEAGFAVTPDLFQQDPRRPVLLVTDDAGGSLRLLVAQTLSLKARVLLGPDRNNVRSADGGCTTATPDYNACLLADSEMDRHLKLLHGACSENASIVDATLLLKAWLRAEGQLHRSEGLSGFVCALVAYHCATAVRPPDRVDAALALFRDALKFLASNAWSAQQQILRGSASDVEWPLPALVDGDMNLAASLSIAAAQEVADGATRALEALRRDAPPGALQLLFTPKTLNYDLTIRLPLLGGKNAYAASLATVQDDTNILGLSLEAAIGRRACALVTQALDRRLRRPPRWDRNGDTIVIGASLSNDACRQVLKGGPPSTDEGKAFRAFWGPKCEARRFKDGRVLEAVVWEAPEGCLGDGWKRALPLRSLVFALKRHEPRRAASVSGEAPGLLRDDAGRVSDARTAFEALASVLRKAEGPLRIDHASPCAPVLRGTCGRVLRPNVRTGVLECLDGVVRFAPSDAWEKLPDHARDAAALSLLATVVPGAKLCKGDAMTRPHVLTRWRGFNLRLAPRLATRHFNHHEDLAHVHHAFLRALTVKHPAFPDACRLLVRWAHAQWLSDYIHQEHLELLCAAVFAPLAANSGVGEVPRAPLSGFVACLRLLATHDFASRALYVDLRHACDAARPVTLIERSNRVALHQRISADYVDDLDPGVAAGALAREAVQAPPEAVVWHLLVDGARTALDHLDDPNALWGAAGGRAARAAAGAFVVMRGDVVEKGGAGLDAPTARGPRALRLREAFRNLGEDGAARAFVQDGPCDAFARRCREAFGDVALFLRDAREPRRVAVVWRPGFDGDATQVLRAVAALGSAVVKRVEVVG